MADWCHRKILKNKQWCSSLTCLVLEAVLKPALCLSALKHNWPKYSSFAELYRVSLRAKIKCQKQRLSASIQQSGWGSTAGCQPLCCVCRCLFHSLSYKEEERRRVSAMGMFFSSHSFSRLSLLKNSLQERENGAGGTDHLNMWHWDYCQ